MHAEVKILVEGFTNASEVGETGEEKTQPTITLVRDEDLIIVVDPGILKSQQVLIDALKRENLKIEDVNVVCITHSHLDHYRNIGMFPNAKTLEYYGLWDGNTIESWSEDFTSNIQVLHTPGHDYTGITLFITTGPESGYPGIVAICGDIFWKENYPEDPKDDTYASDFEKLKDSRDMILKKADWIIPGHGKMYKNNKFDKLTEEGAAAVKEIKKSETITMCRSCGMPLEHEDACICRPQTCFRCCECGLDCNLCSCSHKR